MFDGLNSTDILERLVEEIMDFKTTPEPVARELASAVIDEVELSKVALEGEDLPFTVPITSGVTMGSQGVGCRGTGDFFVHRLVAGFSEASRGVVLSPQDMDDAGAISMTGGRFAVAKMEGMHSRLSDFPFIAGFHVTRAAFRDLYVKGATPSGLLVDVHLADDADVGKLFDFMAGIGTVCDLVDCPILGGSTLRIGGDMVIGTRMTGGVSAIGITDKLLPRRDVRKGDAILMTEGAGGGTICTTALYSGRPEVVKETLNLKFLTASRIILDGEWLESIHCMADVTNGGLRADLHEIGNEAGCGALVHEDEISSLVNREVMILLEENGIDYLGISLDSLLIFCGEGASAGIIRDLEGAGIRSRIIGHTTEDSNIRIERADGLSEFLPRFRESAYTKVKSVVDSGLPVNISEMEARLRRATDEALRRKEEAIELVRGG
jgi:hydrogenase expression/formation protein